MRRRALWLWMAVLFVAGCYLAFRLVGGNVVDSNILSLMPSLDRGDNIQAVQDSISEKFSRRVIFLVGSPSPETSIAAAKTLASVLDHSGTITALTSKVDTDASQQIAAAYFPFRAGLLSPDDRTRLLAGNGQVLTSRALSILYGPSGFANAQLIERDPLLLLPTFLGSLPVPQSRLQLNDGMLTVRDDLTSYALVSADLAGDPFSLAFQTQFERVVLDATASMETMSPDLTILQTGAIFYATDSAREAMSETSTFGILSIVGTLLLILLVFHRTRPILLGLAAIVAGILCAVAGTLLIFDQIHVVALLFGSSLIGISIDYSFEYFCGYFEPQLRTPQQRLSRVLPAIGMGLGTTLIGYCTLLLAPFPGLQQVACFSLIGLSAAFLTVVFCFPALDTVGNVSHGTKAIRLARAHWTLWEAPHLRFVRIAILAACAIGATAGFFFLEVDDDVRHLQSLSPDLKQQESEIARLTGAGSATQFLVIEGENEEALLQHEEGLAPELARAMQDGELNGYTMVSQFAPSVSRQKENRALVADQLMAPHLAAYLAQIGFDGEIDHGPANSFLTPSDLPATGPLSVLHLLAQEVASQPVHVVMLQGLQNPASMTQWAESQSGVHFVSPADDWSRLFGTYRRYALILLGVSVVLMYPLLVWRYGFGQGFRALVPPLAAVALAVPLAALAGVTFTFFNAMALVLVLSIGVDYSVFCIEASETRKPVTSLAVALAALTTIMAFGMLAFSHVFAVHAFGMTMLIGIFFAFLFAPATRNARRVGSEGDRA